MIRYAIAVLTLASVVGCSAGGGFHPFSSASNDDVKNAAYAAKFTYPRDAKASTDLMAMGVVNGNSIKIYNPTDQTINDAKVWINKSFLSHVDTIPAKGSVTLSRSDFFDSNGSILSKQNAGIDRIELQTADNKLYTLQGPVVEQ